MAGVLLPISVVTQYFTNQGVILSLGKVYTYTAGTTTPVATYTDSTLGTQNANPMILDSAGRTTAEFWVPAGTLVKVIVKDSNDVQRGPTLDYIPGLNDVSVTGTLYYGGTSGGSANAQTLSFSSGPSSYSAGVTILWTAGFTNTGATTINVNGLGTKALQNRAQGLVGGEVVAGRTYLIVYTGSAFQLDAIETRSANRVDVSSNATVNLDTAGSRYVRVTGTTTITAITLTNGEYARVLFGGILTLTNGASLILPGGANITTAAGDSMLVVGEASGVVRVLWYQPGTYGNMLQGPHTIPVNANAMVARSTNGAGSSLTESATNKVMVFSKDFDQTTSEYVQVAVPMPKSWNEGTVTADFGWTADGGTPGQTVTWGIQGVSLSDDDAIDAAFGTAVTVTDTLLATGDMHITSATAAITIAGTPAENDQVVFQIYRDIADNLAADARLWFCRIKVTYNAGNDL